MKRVILCVICLICLTGCEVSYDLTVTEESINEVTKVYTDISLNEMGKNISNLLIKKKNIAISR